MTRAESPRLKDIGWGFGGKGNDTAKSNVLRSEFWAKSRHYVRSSRSSRSVDSAELDKRRSTDSAGLCIPTQDKNRPKADFCPSGFIIFGQQKTCAPIRIFFIQTSHRGWSTAKKRCENL